MEKYALPSRIIHWLMALVIVTTLIIGIFMKHFMPSDSQNHLQVFELHKSLGVMVVILVFLRIINRIINKPPILPQTIPQLERILANLGHYALYVMMIIVPLSGYLMSNSFGFPVKFFGIEMPVLVTTNFNNGGFFRNAHVFLAYSLLALVAIHVCAVIRHKFFDKPENDVLKRMI